MGNGAAKAGCFKTAASSTTEHETRRKMRPKDSMDCTILKEPVSDS